MEAFVAWVIQWFALPQNGLSSIFLISFISATLLPLGSEPAVFGYAKLNPDQFWLVVAVATLGNTLGGVVDYWMGRGAQAAVHSHRHLRFLRWMERFGPKTLLLAWLPVIGDPLCTVAGWVRLPFWPCVGWMAVGKGLRYASMTAALMWVPDAWWMKMIKPLMG